MLTTLHLRLVPATATLVRADIEDRAALTDLLGARIPDDWPPEMLADALPWFLGQLEASPDDNVWMLWYCVLAGDEPQDSVLVGSGGFLGPPQDGATEIGYSVLPQFQGKGYATEMAAALVRWALAQPGVARVIADVSPDNTPSVRLLRRLGFQEAGLGAEPDLIRLEVGRKT